MEEKMKKISVILIAILTLFMFACSEKDDNPTEVNVYGYKLDQFIFNTVLRDLIDPNASDTLNFRNLFAYEIIASDGFSPRNSSYAGYDLTWDFFKEGFIVPSDNNRTWFPSELDLPGAFKVKNTTKFNLYRKVDVNSAGKTNTVELKGLTIHSIQNWNSVNEDAIKLSDLIQGITLSDSSNIRLISIDGYSKDYTPEQIAVGYYLMDSEVTTFTTLNELLPGSLKKFKKLASIEVTNSTEQDNSFANAPHDKKDITITVPESFSGYDSTILTDY